MKIEIGEYIRDIFGRIGKIFEYDCGTYRTLKFGASSGEIVKHSKNIIDLIEVGDYVNGCEVIEIDLENEVDNQICVSTPTVKELYLLNSDIETIVTKEQFKNAEYRIPEEK